MGQTPYGDESDIAKVVERFERCEFGLAEFTHARHLTVAAWYLCHLTPPQALVRMRSGLMRFIEHHGRQGYHETITRFWMEVIGNFLEGVPDASIVQKVNKIVELYQNKEVLVEYYSRERVQSESAKKEWLEPDLKQIGANANVVQRSG